MTRFAVLLTATTLVLSGQASGSSLSVQYEPDPWDQCGPRAVSVTYTAYPGESNHVTIGHVREDPVGDTLGGQFWNPCGYPSMAAAHALAIQDARSTISGECRHPRPQLAICEPVPAILLLSNGDDRVYASAAEVTTTVWAGNGADTIDLANGIADTISCGTGKDTVIADPGDRVAADCERVVGAL